MGNAGPEGATMKRLVETIVRRLSDHPEEARVTESYEGRTSFYEISVPEADRGRLIGPIQSVGGRR